MPEMPAEIMPNEEETQHGKYLQFTIGEEVFGLEIQYVSEIVGLQKISDIPELPDYVKGIINLRGKIIPVIDMSLKLKMSAIAYTDRTCIVVSNIQNLAVGLIVDNVDEVVSIPDTSIVSPPGFKTGFRNSYIKGISKMNNEVRLLLDCEKLFADKEIEPLTKI